MEVFLSLYKALWPYLLCIPVGYFLARRFKFPKSIVSKPLLFFFMPILVINHVLEASIQKLTILPIISFSLSICMILPAVLTHKLFAKDESRSLLKSGFSFFNVAFFGIPVVDALFGEEAITTLICIYIGSALYGNIIGYFQVARARFSRKHSIKEIFKVPFIYVFVLAVLLKIIGVETPTEVKPVVSIFGKVVAAAGMMIIGINIEKVNFKLLKWFYYLKLLVIRQLGAILFMTVLLLLEYSLVNGLAGEEKKILILLAFFPIAANLTVFASFLKANEKQSALLVLFSMLLSLLLVPLVTLFF